MFYPAITLYELASPKYATLLRTANEQRAAFAVAPVRNAQPSWRAVVRQVISAVLDRQPAVPLALPNQGA
jgi:hypothetical protein